MMSHSQKTCRILPLCRMRHHPRPFVTLLPPGPRSAGKPLTFWPRNRVLARIGPDPTAHRLCQNRRPGLSPGRSALFGRRGAFGVPERGLVARNREFPRTEGGCAAREGGRRSRGRPRRARGRGGRAARPRRGRERQQRGAGRGNPPFARSRFLWPYRPPILARKTSLLRTPCVRRAPKATTFNHQ